MNVTPLWLSILLSITVLIGVVMLGVFLGFYLNTWFKQKQATHYRIVNTDDKSKKASDLVLEDLFHHFPTVINSDFVKTNVQKHKSNQILAWKTYIDLMTKVMGNSLDNNNVSVEETLEHVNVATKNMCHNMLELPNSAFTAVILIQLLNEILRPFLSKWHREMRNNRNRIVNIATFKDELATLKLTIIANKYLLNLAKIAKISYNINDLQRDAN